MEESRRRRQRVAARVSTSSVSRAVAGWNCSRWEERRVANFFGGFGGEEDLFGVEAVLKGVLGGAGFAGEGGGAEGEGSVGAGGFGARWHGLGWHGRGDNIGE